MVRFETCSTQIGKVVQVCWVVSLPSSIIEGKKGVSYKPFVVIVLMIVAMGLLRKVKL